MADQMWFDISVIIDAVHGSVIDGSSGSGNAYGAVLLFFVGSKAIEDRLHVLYVIFKR